MNINSKNLILVSPGDLLIDRISSYIIFYINKT